MLGVTGSFALEFAQGQDIFDEALQTSLRIGNFRAEMLARAAVTYILIPQGQFDAALETAQAAYEVAMEYGVPAFAVASLRHLAWAHLEAGDAPRALDTIEEAWQVIAEKHLEKFVGPLCLGILARSTTSAERRVWAMEEGLRILEAGSMGINHIFFHRDIMELGLAESDCDLVERMGRKLASFTQAEPLPWCQLVIDRANAIGRVRSGQSGSKPAETLRAVRHRAEEAGFKILLPAIDACFGQADT